MSYQLSFGMHQGRTHEWLFFHTPWYADYIMRKGIHRQPHNFDEEEGDHFAELFRRASHLTGLCPRCGERPITYMGLTRLHGTGTLGHVDFYCDECEYMGGSPTGYYQPSFFLEYDVPRCEQLRINQSPLHRRRPDPSADGAVLSDGRIFRGGNGGVVWWK